MEALQALREGLTLVELAKGLVIALVLGRCLVSSSETAQKSHVFPFSASSRAQAAKTAGFFSIFLAARSWLALVDKYVPEPYLDEIFHIPQAQAYCEGRFWDWDDKITTPPGLYLLSVAYHKFWMLAQCTPFSLRSNNLLATLLTALVAAQCRHLVAVRAAESQGRPVPRSVSIVSYLIGLNISLFPVIFFFSALYYTDVVSTLVVLVAYRNHLRRLGSRRPGIASDLWTVVLGVAALFMRQTNVFWVVVYMGGLEAVHVLKSVGPSNGESTNMFDPPLNEAGPYDWLFCAWSIAVAAVLNPARVLRQIWPHMTVLVLFAGFVAWNGGVVLGDKSNHVATVHLAQMLYIWPFFAFFSAPLFLPSVLSILSAPLRLLSSQEKSPTTPNRPLPAWRSALLKAHGPLAVLTTLLSLAVVRYNTVVHPFTLADNRHYMFYVFRYTILRSPARRLSLVAVYTVARWFAWAALAGYGTTTGTAAAGTGATTSSERRSKDRDAKTQAQDDPAATPPPPPPPTSTALLWLLTAALSLVTAPLVEPRYFILPWVFYRLLVPSGSVGLSARGDGAARADARLALETAWFAAVNAATMAVFLFRPFYWRSEDGELLDGGRVQRFMW